MTDEGDELGHSMTKPSLLVGLGDGAAYVEGSLPLGKKAGERWLVGDQRSYSRRVPGDQGECIHCAPAAGEHVHWPKTDGVDDGGYVVSVNIRVDGVSISSFSLRSTPRGS